MHERNFLDDNNIPYADNPLHFIQYIFGTFVYTCMNLNYYYVGFAILAAIFYIRDRNGRIKELKKIQEEKQRKKDKHKGRSASSSRNFGH